MGNQFTETLLSPHAWSLLPHKSVRRNDTLVNSTRALLFVTVPGALASFLSHSYYNVYYIACSHPPHGKYGIYSIMKICDLNLGLSEKFPRSCLKR